MSDSSMEVEEASSMSTESSKSLSPVEESGSEEVSSSKASNVQEQLLEETDLEDQETTASSPLPPSRKFEEVLNNEVFWNFRVIGEFHELAILALTQRLRKMGYDAHCDDVREYFNRNYDLEAASEFQEQYIPECRPDHRGFSLEDPDPRYFPEGSFSRLLHLNNSTLLGLNGNGTNDCIADKIGKEAGAITAAGAFTSFIHAREPNPPSKGETAVNLAPHGVESEAGLMEAEEFRKWGKRMIDYVADYWETLPSRKPCSEVKPGYIRQLVPADAPEEGESWENIFADLESVVMKGVTHWHHPRFFSYFPTGNSYPAVIGDILSDGIGALGFTWHSSPAYTELEMVVMDWLAKMIGLPEKFLFTHNGPGGGVIQGSASEGVYFSMMAARKWALRNLTEEQNSSNLIAYASEQAHSSVERAAMLNCVKFRPVKSDDLCRMTAAALEEAIQKDKEAGLIPFFACATLGTTASCAIDCLPEIGPLCSSSGIWLHVDAAYGGSAATCPEYRWIMQGIEHADTITHNPHKALMVNFDYSAFWTKNYKDIEQAFSINPQYLTHQQQGSVPDYRDWGVPFGRRFRALKLWFTVRVYGVEGIRKNFRKLCSMASYLAGLVRKDPRFEIVQPVIFGLVCFRLKLLNTLNDRVLAGHFLRMENPCIFYVNGSRTRFGAYLSRSSVAIFGNSQHQ